MAHSPKIACLLAVFVIVAMHERAESATVPCLRTNPDKEALKLASCAVAAQNKGAKPSTQCCSKIKSFANHPSCLCAVLLSNTAKSARINPGIAISIPKRCSLNRPVGKKCG
ncbi:Bifunctional inhibitor/lipid-transfer protein/seed storage 2S albumin superfamily protein, partial [Striga hermonthica]